ncbi:MAG: peptide chain release factor N(5)-glutamine methyltransferase, partial [Candidatus Omnitrophota bacterium]
PQYPRLKIGGQQKMNEQEYILTYILDCPRADLYLNEVKFNAAAQGKLEEILALRRRGLPLQYILGWVEFMGLNFKVDPRVLIPRPETEILVEAVLEETRRLKIEDGRLIDLGTGSGNIAVSLAKHLPNCRILATDISSVAITVARENSRLNGTDGQIEFLVCDLFSAIDSDKCFDVVVSNPPYISQQEMEGLAPEVKSEPREALFGGLDGLDFYRRIIKESPVFLKKNGLLIMEMGHNQSQAIQEIIRQSGLYRFEKIVNDYRDIERVIIVRKMSNV